MSTVLIIEDDVEMARMLEVILGTLYDVTICTEKAHAIQRAKHFFHETVQPPDCVVIDLIINGVGGVDFYYWMRGEGYDCPVIFLTGCHQQSPEYQAALETGEHIYEKDYFSTRTFMQEVAMRVAQKAGVLS